MVRNCKEINFKFSLGINFSVRNRGAQRSGAASGDDNDAQENLNKRKLKFIDEQFLIYRRHYNFLCLIHKDTVTLRNSIDLQARFSMMFTIIVIKQ